MSELLISISKMSGHNVYCSPKLPDRVSLPLGQTPLTSIINHDIGQLEPLNLMAGRLDFDGVDPVIGMELLSIYWSRQLYTAQIIYRPAFMRDMACGGPYFSKLLLNSIFFVVSKHCHRPGIRSDPDDNNTAGLRYRQRFTELLRDRFDKSDITTLQALLIMSNALFSRCDERSLSWLYAGNAFNMIIDLGLHVLPSTSGTSAEELEIRKRVVWGAYCKFSFMLDFGLNLLTDPH